MKFIHFSDFHLNDPFTDYSASPVVLKKRHDSLMNAFQQAMNLALIHRVDLVLIPGNLFENGYVTRRTLASVAEKFCALGDTRIFIAPGEADCAGPDSPYHHFPWPNNVHIFKNPSLEYVDIPELQATVYGAGVASRGENAPILTGFRVENPDHFNILLLHAWDRSIRAEAAPSGFPLRTENLKSMGINYAALGRYLDYHEIRTENGDICGCYPGSPEWLGPEGFSEKRVILASREEDDLTLTPIHTTHRKYRHLEMEEANLDRDTINRFLNFSQISEEDLVRLTLKGHCSAQAAPDIMAFLKELEERFFCFHADNRIRIDRPGPEDQDSPENSFVAALLEHFQSQEEGIDQNSALALKFGCDLIHSVIPS